ncbi:hypothetical protein [Polymorphobacter multimanifer]|uniref:hypothetical protein n=1 Tax=Polymorphobacter multimanifer TaxID=1070431 RepID=UPI00161810FB|nr:hypothetical protein [Polymorphobacter multimanifer]
MEIAMLRARVFGLGLLAIAAMGVGACADQYAYGRAPGYGNTGGYADYNQYWGDPYGYRNVPVGYVGQGFGWNNGYYYPGNGNFVYDRRGSRRAWNQQQRSYWQPRIVTQRPVIGNRIGGAIARQGVPQGQIRQQRQLNRQQVQVDRQRTRVERQANRVERRGNQVQRQGNQVQRQQNRVVRQQQRQERRNDRRN